MSTDINRYRQPFTTDWGLSKSTLDDVFYPLASRNDSEKQLTSTFCWWVHWVEEELRCCSPSTSSSHSQHNTLGSCIDIFLKCHSRPCSSITSSSYLQPAWISVDPVGQHLRPAPEVGADTAAQVTFLERVSWKWGLYGWAFDLSDHLQGRVTCLWGSCSKSCQTITYLLRLSGDSLIVWGGRNIYIHVLKWKYGHSRKMV